MYNRYIPNGTLYTRVVEEDGDAPLAAVTPPSSTPLPSAPSPPSPSEEEPPGAKKSTGLAGLLKGLKLEDIDTGDVLLLLILLFLLLEGDDIELVITLGLVLVLSL